MVVCIQTFIRKEMNLEAERNMEESLHRINEVKRQCQDLQDQYQELQYQYKQLVRHSSFYCLIVDKGERS